jgi:hypothetical protein
MNKSLIAAAVAGLLSVAIAPSVFAQAQTTQNTTVQTPPAEKSQQLTELTVTFVDTDSDKNGEISFKEATAVHPSMTQAQFDLLDKDKNGTLNEAEYIALDAAPRVGQEAN